MDEWIDRWTVTQTDRWMQVSMKEQTTDQADRETGKKDRQIDGLVDVETEKREDEQADREIAI